MVDKKLLRRGLCVVLKGPHRNIMYERNNEIVIAYRYRNDCFIHVPRDYDRNRPALFHYLLKEKYSKVLNDWVPYLVLKFKRYLYPNERVNADFAIAIVEEPIAHRVYSDYTFCSEQGEVEPVMNVKDAIVNNVPMIDCVEFQTRLSSHGGAIFIVLLPRGYSVHFTWKIREFREVSEKELKLSF